MKYNLPYNSRSIGDFAKSAKPVNYSLKIIGKIIHDQKCVESFETWKKYCVMILAFSIPITNKRIDTDNIRIRRRSWHYSPPRNLRFRQISGVPLWDIKRDGKVYSVIENVNLAIIWAYQYFRPFWKTFYYLHRPSHSSMAFHCKETKFKIDEVGYEISWIQS